MGLDTSAYTASVAIMDEQANLLGEARRRVVARPGAVGVRQSEALFQHIRHLPELMDDPTIAPLFRAGCLKHIAVSGRPRPQPGSYMPVFQAAICAGRLLARATGAAFTELTHQEGHLLAALYDKGPSPELPPQLLFLHISGGTTELIRAQTVTGPPDEFWRQVLFRMDVIGGTLDLKAGQFVDRVAQLLGLGFPGGPALEELAASMTESPLTGQKLSLKVGRPKPGKADGAGRPGQLPDSGSDEDGRCWISFSGPASQVERWVQAGSYRAAEIAGAVQRCLEDGLGQLLQAGLQRYPGWPIWVAGGVAANQGVRRRLSAVAASAQPPVDIQFARPERSSDNAIGLAYAAWLLDHRTGAMAGEPA
ncbi:MAG: hypothetical protein IMX01_06510 [Limnochordaceae bacterium]|nr:hypothetical protein [Limnochordaceae bacterium]